MRGKCIQALEASLTIWRQPRRLAWPPLSRGTWCTSLVSSHLLVTRIYQVSSQACQGSGVHLDASPKWSRVTTDGHKGPEEEARVSHRTGRQSCPRGPLPGRKCWEFRVPDLQGHKPPDKNPVQKRTGRQSDLLSFLSLQNVLVLNPPPASIKQ